MTKPKNRCDDCGGKFGLVSYFHFRLHFCRRACRDRFLARVAKERIQMAKWLGLLAGASKA
jgi:hypothetical protein